MPSMTVRLRSIPDTEAALGWADGHTITVDRPSGKAGGQGLGFNGGQLLGLAIGGCFCNDIRYVAHAMGIGVRSIAVEVSVAFEGDPLIATGADMQAEVTPVDADADIEALLRRAEATSTVSNSLQRGIPVRIGRSEPR
jgi:organic hydroperoxide reductase OsmC/OhrA